MTEKNYESPSFMELEFNPEGALCQSTATQSLSDWEVVQETW